jgi:hypothetical protein
VGWVFGINEEESNAGEVHVRQSSGAGGVGGSYAMHSAKMDIYGNSDGLIIAPMDLRGGKMAGYHVTTLVYGLCSIFKRLLGRDKDMMMLSAIIPLIFRRQSGDLESSNHYPEASKWTSMVKA